MAAFSFLAGKRKVRENHNQLLLLLLSQCQDEKVLNKQLKEWEKDD